VTIEVSLFGFGEDQPPAFHGKNSLQLDISTPATPWAVLQAAGIGDATGLVLMDQDSVIPDYHWNDSIIDDESRLTLLSVFEGG
jgi:sulfur carrier protein ThiS